MSRDSFHRICAFSLTILLLFGCSSRPAPVKDASNEPAPSGSLELVFTYGSEKEAWIKDVTAIFNAANHKTSKGRSIFVRALPMGSGDVTDEVLSGRRQTHLISPASGAFIKLGNTQ